MCIPAPIAIGLGIGAAKTGLDIINRQQQIEYQEEAYKRNAEQANRQAKESYFQTAVRVQTEKAAIAQRIEDIQRQSQEIQAVTSVRAAEAGVSGASVAASIQETQADEGRAIAREIRNRELAALQGEFANRSTRLQTQSSILAAQPSGIPGVDLFGNLGAGLQIAAAGDAAFGSDGGGSPNPAAGGVNP